MRRRRTRTIRTPHGDGLASQGVAPHRGHRCVGQGRHRRERARPVRPAHLAGPDAPPRDPPHHDPPRRRAPRGPSRIVAPRARRRPAAGGNAGSCHRRVIDDLHEVVHVTESLANGEGVDDEWAVDDGRYVLMCTNGRHDACCATFGRPVIRALRESRGPTRSGSAHTSAATASPRTSWCSRTACTSATSSPESAAALLAAHDEGRLDLSCFRGRSTLRLAEQCAEHHVRQQLGCPTSPA